jgi:large subunit ribosomal protein L15
MKLHELKPAEGSRKGIKRVGRGVASGWGKTAGRGNKGHKARSGGQTSPGFEGGQMPLQRRLPKRGFANIFRKRIAIVNIRDLARFESGSVVDRAALIKAGLVKGDLDGVKLLAQGDITVPLTVRLQLVSESAKAKIEAAGGKIEVDA